MMGVLVLVLGVIAFVVGVLGCLTSKCKNCCFATLFIILSGVVGLITLIIAVSMLGLGGKAMIG